MAATDTTGSFAEDIVGREVGSEDTAERYARWATRFEAWRPQGDPTAEMLREFDTLLESEDHRSYPWENSRGKSAPPSYAYRSRVQALSGVKLWAEYEYDTRIEKEVQNIALGEPADFDPTIIDPVDVQGVIAQAPLACDNPDCQTAIQVGYDAILRGSELADVRAEDVNRDDQTLYVRAKKGSEPTNIKLGDEAWQALLQHANAHPKRDYLFRNSYDRAWTADAWNQHFRRKHHPAGFHALARHSAITNRLKQEDFGSVYLRARHQNTQTTLKYVDAVGLDAPDWVGDR